MGLRRALEHVTLPGAGLHHPSGANTRTTLKMASYRKNIAVGGTMIVALTLLAVMIILFGDAPVRWFRPAQAHIRFEADSAEGITNGSPILYLGVNVGQ